MTPSDAQKTPLEVLRLLCDMLINTRGMILPNLELALSLEGDKREAALRRTLVLANRDKWALETLDLVLGRLETEVVREPSMELDAARRVLCAPQKAEYLQKSAGKKAN
jgi:hypothetical protein